MCCWHLAVGAFVGQKYNNHQGLEAPHPMFAAVYCCTLQRKLGPLLHRLVLETQVGHHNQ
jgi:hypothetical protein